MILNQGHCLFLCGTHHGTHHQWRSPMLPVQWYFSPLSLLPAAESFCSWLKDNPAYFYFPGAFGILYPCFMDLIILVFFLKWKCCHFDKIFNHWLHRKLSKCSASDENLIEMTTFLFQCLTYSSITKKIHVKIKKTRISKLGSDWLVTQLTANRGPC